MVIEAEFQISFPTLSHSVQWSLGMWIDHIQTGGGRKKRFQYCTNSIGSEILYLQPIQGHSGENPVDPSLLDNVLIPEGFLEFV